MSEPVKDGEVEAAVATLESAIEAVPPSRVNLRMNARNALASLARRGRGHARNCACHSWEGDGSWCHWMNCAHEFYKEKHPFTDPRCAPFSEGAREKVREALSQMRRNRFTKAISLLEEALGEGK